MRPPLLFAALAICLPGFLPAQVKRTNLPPLLSFEGQQTAGAPTGWSGGPAGTLFADDQITHSGKWAARIERDATSPNTFSTITLGLPVDFAGERIALRGFLRTQDVSEFAGLWLREDGDRPGLAFDNMQKRGLRGTSEWTEYSIDLPLNPGAKMIFFGVLSAGSGKTWADDLQLLVDGKPVWDAPAREIEKTVLDTDHEFDNGSKISLSSLSKTQISNLATLGRVWGFAKYHHPVVVSGKRHWDYDLFHVLPRVLAAADASTANAAITTWLASLGDFPDCSSCATLGEKELYLKPDLAWIHDEKTLGADLSRALDRIDRNRPWHGAQFFVSQPMGAGNPSFDHESAYPAIHLPDAGFQLLALYRMWNIIEYWYPYRNVANANWNAVLDAFIPRIALAKTSQDYQREFMAFLAEIHDTHANLWRSLGFRPPLGSCRLPVATRFIEDRAIVTGYSQVGAAETSALRIGDALLTLDGTPVTELVDRWHPYYAASNEPTVFRDIARSLTRGECGPSALRVLRGQDTIDLTVSRTQAASTDAVAGTTHDLAGDTFRRLSDDVAYLKLSGFKAAEAPRYVESAKGTRGLIIDIRNYPSEFAVFALGSLLTSKPVAFVRFTSMDLWNPGAFHWTAPLSLSPAQPHYEGKIVVLLDETSQSQAEYTAMAFRAAGALIVGSTTAGADGNVSPIPIPGGFSAMISGIGVFYPDRKPTQRIGIIPDIESRPTIAGIRAGRDEVLEVGVRQILGPGVSEEKIRATAAPRQ